MNFLKRDGCVCSTLEVDGVEEINMTDEQRLKILDVMYDYMKHDLSNFNYMLDTFVEVYGDYSCDDEPCECCGDYVCEWNLEVTGPSSIIKKL